MTTSDGTVEAEGQAPLRPVLLLHTADVHLGSGTEGPDGREERAFARGVDLAIEADVDGVIVAGDLFDHARVPEALLVWTAEQFDRLGRPVVLLVGNHDALHNESVHHRFRVMERCAQVKLLDDPNGSMIEVTGTDVVVWGRAMVERRARFPTTRRRAGKACRAVGRRGRSWDRGHPQTTGTPVITHFPGGSRSDRLGLRGARPPPRPYGPAGRAAPGGLPWGYGRRWPEGRGRGGSGPAYAGPGHDVRLGPAVLLRAPRTERAGASYPKATR